MSISARHAREDWTFGVVLVVVGIDVVLAEGGRRKEGGEVEDVVASPGLGGQGEFELEGSDDRTQEFLEPGREHPYRLYDESKLPWTRSECSRDTQRGRSTPLP